VLLALSWLVLRSIRKLGCVGVGRGALWRLRCFVDPLVFVAEAEGEVWRFFPKKKKKNQKPERTEDDDVVLALAMLLFAVIVERARREERNREV
jgi:hypothetical protein